MNKRDKKILLEFKDINKIKRFLINFADFMEEKKENFRRDCNKSWDKQTDLEKASSELLLNLSWKYIEKFNNFFFPLKKMKLMEEDLKRDVFLYKKWAKEIDKKEKIELKKSFEKDLQHLEKRKRDFILKSKESKNKLDKLYKSREKKVLSNSSPPVRTSDRKSDSASQKDLICIKEENQK